LTADFVEDIHKDGGTVLGTSRGPVDTGLAVDNLIRRDVQMLFTVGGDGTQRGARDLYQEASRRGYPLSVVGIPKTIDNDVAYVARTFGYLTAVEQACQVIDCAHMEAHSVMNGISLVKLMGRHAGFITAGATMASQDVNFTLIPEVPFRLDGEHGFLATLKRRVLNRAHAVIAVAEGAGQDLLEANPQDRDASGNVRLKDVGLFLREQIAAYFRAEQIPIVLRYFDPSYIIRSVPAGAEDSILCDLFARHAAHAAMAGKTGLAIGLLHDRFIHVPIETLTSGKKRLDPNGPEWHAVLAATGQPEEFY
jgi:6-phosphofructokinase 1